MRTSLDPRGGSRSSFAVRRQGQEINHVGEYLEIDRPRRLRFAWGMENEEGSDGVTIDIVPLEPGCELTLTHELHPDWADFAKRAEDAWIKTLSALVATLGSWAVTPAATYVQPLPHELRWKKESAEELCSAFTQESQRKICMTTLGGCNR